MPKRLFVTGTDTDAGKSVVSALLVQALQADYWKPIQSGTTPHTDSQWLSSILDLSPDRIHPEGYLLDLPASPHASAEAEGVTIDPHSLRIPHTERPLIIEGAGGLMVPLTREYLLIDLMAEWKIPVVLVCHTVLGSINHSLLSIEALRNRNIPLQGIVFNDGGRPESESVILEFSKAPLLGRLPKLATLNPESLQNAFDQHFHPSLL